MHTSLNLTLYFFIFWRGGWGRYAEGMHACLPHLISVCSTLHFKNSVAKCLPSVDSAVAVASNHIDKPRILFYLCTCFDCKSVSVQCEHRHRTRLCSYEPHFYPTCLCICWWVWNSLFIYLLLEPKPTFVCLSQCLSSVRLRQTLTSSIGALVSVTFSPFESSISVIMHFVGYFVISHVYRFVNTAALSGL